MNKEYIFLLILCFLLAQVGNYLAHKKKNIKRPQLGVIAIGLLSGLASSLLVLLLITFVPLYMFVIGIVVSLTYSYFMADAKAFQGLR